MTMRHGLPCGQTVVERAHETTFRAAELLIGRQMQAGLDLSPLKQLVIFAPHHIREFCEICHNRHRAIWPIQSQRGMVLREMVRREVAPDDDHHPAQFLPKLSVARPAKRAEPSVLVRLQGGGAVRATSPRLRPVQPGAHSSRKRL